MEDTSELAHDLIQTFLDRMTKGEVAAFSLAYVGMEEEQKCTFSGGNGDHEIASKLIEMIEMSLAGIKDSLKKDTQ